MPVRAWSCSCLLYFAMRLFGNAFVCKDYGFYICVRIFAVASVIDTLKRLGPCIRDVPTCHRRVVHIIDQFDGDIPANDVAVAANIRIPLCNRLGVVRAAQFQCYVGVFAKAGHVGRFSLSRSGVFYRNVRVNAAHGEAKYCPDVGYRNSERKALYSAALFEVHGVYICKIGARKGRLRSVNITFDGNISASARPRSPNVRVSCSRDSGGRAP